MANLNTSRKKYENQEATIRQFLETGEYETNVAILDSTNAPDVPRTIWGKLAGLCFGNHHKHYRMAMYQTWQGSRSKIMVQMGRSPMREPYQLNATDKPCFSSFTSTRIGSFKKSCNANINQQRAKPQMTSSHVNNFRHEYLQGAGKICPESRVQFQGPRKHHLIKWKPKTGTSTAVGHRMKIDIETPKSVLVGKDLKVLINERTFASLPLPCQHHLLTLLPLCDQMKSELKALSLGAKALNNEFFTQSCVEWSDRLAEGEFTPENRLMMKSEDKERLKMDEWKVRHFEANWGDRLASPEVFCEELQPSAASGSSICLNSDERPSKRRKITRIEKATSFAPLANCATQVAAPVIEKLTYCRVRLPGRPRSRFPCRAHHFITNVLNVRAVAASVPVAPVVGGLPHQTETKLVTLEQSVLGVVSSISSHGAVDFKVPDLSAVSEAQTSDSIALASPLSWPEVATSSSRRSKSFWSKSQPHSEWRPIVDPVVDAVHMDHPYSMIGVTRVTESMLQYGANDESLMRGVIARLTVMSQPKDVLRRDAVSGNGTSQSMSERSRHALRTSDVQVESNVVSVSRSGLSNKHVGFTGELGGATGSILNGDETHSSKSSTVGNRQRVNIVCVRKSSHSESQTAVQLRSVADSPFLCDIKSLPVVETVACPVAQLRAHEHANHSKCDEDLLTFSDMKDIENSLICDSVTVSHKSCVSRNHQSRISVASNGPDWNPTQSALSHSDDLLPINVLDESLSAGDESQSGISRHQKFPLQVKVYCVRPKNFTEHGNNNNLTNSLKTIVRKFALDSLNEPVCGIITSTHNPDDRTQSPCKRLTVRPSPVHNNLENETETPTASIIISDDSSECC